MSPYPEAHKIAAWAASVMGEPAVPQLLKVIPSRREHNAIRQGALNEIEWAIKSVGEPAIPHLLEALDGGNSIAAELAIKTLRELGFSDTLHIGKSLSPDVLIPKLNEILSKDTRKQTHLLIDFISQQTEKIQTLGDIGSPQAISTLINLIPMFRDEPIFEQGGWVNQGGEPNNIIMIRECLGALQHIGNPSIEPLLQFYNGDQISKRNVHGRENEEQRIMDKLVKISIIEFLGKNVSTQSHETFQKMLGEENDDHVINLIIDIIRKSSDPEPTLIGLLNHESKRVQQLAVDALSWVKKNQ